MSGRESLDALLASELARWRAAGLGRELALANRDFADFTSNDYLGLSNHATIVEAARAALAEHGVGGRASRLLGGGSPFDARAENAVAEWLGAEAALLFPSGYHANLGLLQTLVGPGDLILSDEWNHASLIDAARLSRARVQVYRHADVEHAAHLLELASGAKRVLVVTESIFSMDGDHAPLETLRVVCERRGAWLVVDEAHAIGLIGPNGAGAWAGLGREFARDPVLAARIVTGGKALGVSGAFAVGSKSLRDELIHRARAFVFTTAVSPAVSSALEASIELARRDAAPRARARALAKRFASAIGAPEPASAIVPIVVGANDTALRAAALAREARLDVRAVRPPTVPDGTARLRVVLHASNTDEELARLIDFARAIRSAKPTPIRAARATAELLVVAGTDTNVGKTVVSALLARDAMRRGACVYWKPVQTGEESDTRTVVELANLAREQALVPLHHFARPASPHEAARAEHRAIDVDALERTFDEERATLGGGCLIAELAGGLLVPLDDRVTQLDLLARMAAPLVLVARSGVGTLNHTLLSLEALRARRLEPRALFLVGEPHESNRETLARLGNVARIFEVPRFEPLDGAALDRWLAHHDLAGVWKP